MAADKALFKSSLRQSTEQGRGASERGNISAIAIVVAGVMRRQLSAAWWSWQGQDTTTWRVNRTGLIQLRCRRDDLV